MNYQAALSRVFNRGTPPPVFLDEMVEWAKTAPDEIFAENEFNDIYTKVREELGPYENLTHRKAVMLEVMRVLAGFESSWDWREGVDTSRLGEDTPENSEAGAWQVSFDGRRLAPELPALLVNNGVTNGITFQRVMKFNHPIAMEFVARLMRRSTKHNGPLYKGSERDAIRRSLRGEDHAIYKWLNRGAVGEFVEALG